MERSRAVCPVTGDTSRCFQCHRQQTTAQQQQCLGRDVASTVDRRPSAQSSAWQQVMRGQQPMGLFSVTLPGGGSAGGCLVGVFPAAVCGALISPSGSSGATMAEEQRDLISSDGSSGVLPVGNTQRSALGRRTALSALSILVALLIAGQAVTIYYVYQQSGQISKLTKTSQTLKLESLQRRMPTSAQPANKMTMSMMNMPMAMKVLPLAPSVGDMPLEVMKPRSNKTEDQVRHLLLRADPRKTFPELKDDMLGNLKNLKKTMSAMDWQDFEAWMHKWLLFEMAKGPKVEEKNAVPAEKVQTKCQAEASFGGVHPGRFRPECDENGDYLPKQCFASTGFCWCSYKNGTKIEGTDTRGELDCSVSATTEPEEMIFSGVDMLKAK